MPLIRGTALQNVLFDICDEIRRQIEVAGFLESVDATSYLILKSGELLSQAEAASLIPSSEAKGYANQVMSATSGVRSLQENAPIDGTTSQDVAAVNREVLKVVFTILNKAAALKTSLAMNNLQRITSKW